MWCIVQMILVFDLFGVLLSSSLGSAQDELSLLMNRPVEEIAPVYRNRETDFDLGKINSRQFWQRINADLGTSATWQELDNAVLDSIKPLPGSFELLESLQEYPLALLSNTRQEWYQVLNGRYRFERYFTRVFLSFTMHMVKPDPRIYTEVIRELSLPPQQIVYLDDSAQNVAAAAAQGITGILFTNALQARCELSKWISFKE